MLSLLAGREILMLGNCLFRYTKLLGEEENVHALYRGRDSGGWVKGYIWDFL